MTGRNSDHKIQSLLLATIATTRITIKQTRLTNEKIIKRSQSDNLVMSCKYSGFNG